jgi:hypothetical protein
MPPLKWEAGLVIANRGLQMRKFRSTALFAECLLTLFTSSTALSQQTALVVRDIVISSPNQITFKIYNCSQVAAFAWWITLEANIDGRLIRRHLSQDYAVSTWRQDSDQSSGHTYGELKPGEFHKTTMSLGSMQVRSADQLAISIPTVIFKDGSVVGDRVNSQKMFDNRRALMNQRKEAIDLLEEHFASGNYKDAAATLESELSKELGWSAGAPAPVIPEGKLTKAALIRELRSTHLALQNHPEISA